MSYIANLSISVSLHRVDGVETRMTGEKERENLLCARIVATPLGNTCLSSRRNETARTSRNLALYDGTRSILI